MGPLLAGLPLRASSPRDGRRVVGPREDPEVQLTVSVYASLYLQGRFYQPCATYRLASPCLLKAGWTLEAVAGDPDLP